MGHLLFAISVISIHLNALLEFHSFGEFSHNLPKFWWDRRNSSFHFMAHVAWIHILRTIHNSLLLCSYFCFCFQFLWNASLAKGWILYTRWARYKMIIKRLSFSFSLLDEMLRPLCHNALGRMMKVNNCLSIF